jgi:hypothetical protein
MRGIAGLYDQRLKAGKNTPAGKGLKLIYNSVYGKFAQSVGEPKYGNAIYASLITSGCREMILNAIASHPEGNKAVVMVATDGVYFTSRHHGLDISNRLGDWEETRHDGLTLFKPGIYWDDETRRKIAEGGDPAFKARGISARYFSAAIACIDADFARWQGRDPADSHAGLWYPAVRFDTGFAMVTCQQVLQRGKWGMAGTLGHEPVEGGCQGCSGGHLVQDSWPGGKRRGGHWEGRVWRTEPYEDGGPGDGFGVPYDRRFGQPDPDEYGITDDGTVKDQWATIFR